MGRKIVLTTVGSLGDLHPFLALGRELKRRGHRPVIASTEAFREPVTRSGLAFHPVRALASEAPSAELIRRVFQGRKGIEYILRQLVMPALSTAFEDTLAASANADLVVGHPLTLAAPLVAKVLGIPWISTQLAPTGMLSAFDPPLLPGLAWVHRLRPSPAAYRLFYRLAEAQMSHWFQPLYRLRAELGLGQTGNPLFRGGHSPTCELALFSPLFGPPQADWPAQTRVTGFPFFEQPAALDPALQAFLNAGTPPIIFTLGSSAVLDPRNFFEVSAAAARALGRRAVLVGVNSRAPHEASVSFGPQSSEDTFVSPYGAYAQIFPHGAAIVHQGGVGTTAEALRAGRPMLVVPYGVDQPDNAARASRLGVGRVLSRRQYRPKRVIRELSRLLGESAFAERAKAIGEAIRGEKGAAAACDAIEAVLSRSRVRSSDGEALPVP